MSVVASSNGGPRKRDGRLRVIVLGYIVRGPLGGLAWHHLQYVIGLARLGHDVYFFEDSDDYPSCYDPVRSVTDTNPTYGLAFAANAFEKIGMGDRWAYYDAHTSGWSGTCANRVAEICKTSDLLLNLSGVNPLRPWLLEIAARALIDTDPAFTQIRHLTNAEARARAEQHTAFFSFGENIGSSRSSIPDDGLPWRPTRQPVVLDFWPTTPGPAGGKFTTIMQWDSYPARQHNGSHYGMKSDSFEPYIDLPRKTSFEFELAIGSGTAPREELRAHGWSVLDPREPTRDPWTYQEYIQNSKAEFSVAKHGYVSSRSGWFSERSAAYLASARPVVTQETGFSDWLKTGAGIVSFNSLEEALDGVEEISGRYDFHCREARNIAVEYFDSGKVLASLIVRAMDKETAAETYTTCRANSDPQDCGAPAQ